MENNLKNYQNVLYNELSENEKELISKGKNLIKVNEDLKINQIINNDINPAFYESNIKFNEEENENQSSNVNVNIPKFSNNNNPITNTQSYRINFEEKKKKLKLNDNELIQPDIFPQKDKSNHFGYIKKAKKSISLNQKNFETDKFLPKNSNIPQSEEEINEIREENLNLKSKNQILEVSLLQKDKQIYILNKRIKELENLLKNKDKKKSVNYDIENLVKEKENLYNENQKLLSGINTFNQQLKEVNQLYTNKTQEYINEINSYKNKLSDYKRKIILLKRKIDELYTNKNISEYEKSPNMVPLINYLKENNNNMKKVTYNNFKTSITPDRISNVKNKLDTNSRLYTKQTDDILGDKQKKFAKDFKLYLENINV